MPTELERENLHNLDVGDDYHLQGDAKWETERKRVERERLQASAKIRSAAMQFWTTLGLHSDDKMTKQQYLFVHRRITACLAPDMPPDEAASAADEDWDDDRGGDALMSAERYVAGLVSVADLWTNKIDELEYTIFLNKIFHRITRWNRHAELRGVAAPRVTGDSSSEYFALQAGGQKAAKVSTREVQDFSALPQFTASWPRRRRR